VPKCELSRFPPKWRRLTLRRAGPSETACKSTLDLTGTDRDSILFSHNHLSAVTKVTFLAIKLVRPLHVAEYDFLCSREELCLDGRLNGGSQEFYWWRSAE
jgi:hypothetical protein